jgi:hypothetical protein
MVAAVILVFTAGFSHEHEQMTFFRQSFIGQLEFPDLMLAADVDSGSQAKATSRLLNCTFGRWN